MKQPPSFPDRRQFLKTGGALAAAGLLPHAARATTNQLPALPFNQKTQASMPTRNFGKTGFKVGLFSLGGQSALEKPNNFDIAVPLIERALDLGVNFIDTAATKSTSSPRAGSAPATGHSVISSSPSSS
jgi:TAT (twin-arginine translocation) pathway signal sequence